MKKIKIYEYDENGNIEFTRYDKIAEKYAYNPALLRVILGTIRFLFRIISLPGIRKIHPWVNPKKNFASVLPVNAELKTKDIPLPIEVVHDMIDKSSYRMILTNCGCRAAYECKNHPADIGCILMGEDILQITPGMGRMVSKEEAHSHAQKAIEAGLIPGTGKAVLDTFLFRMHETGRFLSVCFCCHCCCIGSLFKKLPTDHIDAIFPVIEGIEVKVTDECTGCGQYIEYCVYDAITIENGTAVHSRKCRCCGRCAINCPEKAVRVTLDNPDFKESVFSNLEAYGDIT